MFSLKEIAQICNGKLISEADESVSGISCDSRSIQRGDLFVALKGDRFDGHNFLNEVFKKNASGALVEKSLANHSIVLVDNTLTAMQRLANFHRRRFSIQAVAVTGSAGKTTTKECIGRVLSTRFRTRVGFGNWNNHIGVPLNLFKLCKEDECVVMELGANHVGEIKTLSEIMEPTVGVITGVCPVHLEGFGSLEHIYEAKLELADFIESTHGTMVANGDDPELLKRLKKRRRLRIVTFGESSGCDYRMSDVAILPHAFSFVLNRKFRFMLQGYGSFNVMNALGALAVAGEFQINFDELSRSWSEMPQIEGRFQREVWTEPAIELFDDSYNANPKSFEHAIKSFKDLSANRRKIVLIGDMLELGAQAEWYHRQLGHQLAEVPISFLIGVGPLSQTVLDAYSMLQPKTQTIHFKNASEAGEFLKTVLCDGDSVLIKGSHGTGLHQIRSFLRNCFKSSSASV